MKNSTKMASINQTSRPAWVIAIFTLLLAMTWSARAQYTYISGTGALNVYFTNTGLAYAGEFNPTPDLVAPCTQVKPADLDIGAELTPGFFFASALPVLPSSGTYNSGLMVLGTASASVNYSVSAGFLGGTNYVGQSSLNPYNGVINLTNTGLGIAELRLDWTSQFKYSGNTATAIAPFAGGSVAFDLGSWVAVAGGLTIHNITQGTAQSVVISTGGDFLSSYGIPGALFPAYAPSVNFWGREVPPSPLGLNSGDVFGYTGSTLPVNNGDIIETVGFMDFLVDPGSMQVIITPAPAPLLHSANLSGTNLLVDVQNGVAGVTYVTCRSTSVSAPLGTWQPVATNIASSTGNFNFTATNAVNPAEHTAFFIIRAQ
jgi:hypothetical protein